MKAKPSASHLMTLNHRLFLDAFEAISQAIYSLENLPGQNENGDLSPGEKLFLSERMDAIIETAQKAKQDFSSR